MKFDDKTLKMVRKIFEKRYKRNLSSTEIEEIIDNLLLVIEEILQFEFIKLH